MAATRLARSRSTVTAVIDEYLQSSNETVKIMIELEEKMHWDPETSWYERRRFHLHRFSFLGVNILQSLTSPYHIFSAPVGFGIAMPFSLNFYYFTVKLIVVHKKRKKEKIEDLRGLLGHGQSLFDVYFVGNRPPHPFFRLDENENLFFSLYGEDVQ